MVSIVVFSLVFNVFLHLTSSSPLEVVKHDEVLGKINEVKGEINELYKRLNNAAQTYHHSEDGKMCVTKDCVAQSHKLFQNMNTSVDPCDDFYQYSCGNYIKETLIPDDKGSMTASFSPLRDKSKFDFTNYNYLNRSIILNDR